MYLHIGKGLCLNDDDIIAIFNIDYIKNTKEYKKIYERIFDENKLIDISNGKEKSLILVEKNNIVKAYISNINSNTIRKRIY